MEKDCCNLIWRAMKYFIVLTTVFLTASTNAQEEQADIERQVKYFDMNSGLAAKLASPMVENYLEIIGSQRKKIAEIKKDFLVQAKRVQTDKAMPAKQQLASLVKLLEQQDKAIEKMLLKHQVSRLHEFGIFLVINQEGFTNAMVNGFFAKHLELSVPQRRSVQTEAEKALEEYEKTVIKAQKKAIARLRQALPKDKQKKFDDILNPMLRTDGSFWM